MTSNVQNLKRPSSGPADDAADPAPDPEGLPVLVRLFRDAGSEQEIRLGPEGAVEPRIWQYLRDIREEVEEFVLFNETRQRRVDPGWSAHDAGLGPGDRLVVGADAEIPEPLAPYREALVEIRRSGEWPITEERGLDLLELRRQLAIHPLEHVSLAAAAGLPPDDAQVLLDWKPLRERLRDEYRIHLRMVATGRGAGESLGRKLANLRERLELTAGEHHQDCAGVGLDPVRAGELLAGEVPLTQGERDYRAALRKARDSSYDMDSLYGLRAVIEAHGITREQHVRLGSELGLDPETLDGAYEEPSPIPPGRRFYGRELLRLSRTGTSGPDELAGLRALRDRYQIMRADHHKLCRDWNVPRVLAEQLWEPGRRASGGGVGWLLGLGLFCGLLALAHPTGRTLAINLMVSLLERSTDGRYDRDGFDLQSYDREGYDRRGYNRDGFNRLGFDRMGYNREGADTNGRDREGFDRDGYNREGFNREGLDRQGFDREGHDKDGFDHRGFDRQGHDRKGYDLDGFDRNKLDRNGRDRDGFDRLGYDSDGHDREGFNRQGFDRTGYDRGGYDADGFDRSELNRMGETREQAARSGYGPDGYDKEGFDRDGYDREGYDRQGYGRDGFSREGFNRDGRDREGYDRKGLDPQGYDKEGRDSWGYDRKGLDRNGFDRDGYGADGYDRGGWNRMGRDRDGFDRDGYGRDGFDRAGYDRSGHDRKGFDRAGYDRDGFDRNGYNPDGFDREGRTATGEDLLRGRLKIVKDQSSNLLLTIDGRSVKRGETVGDHGVRIERVGQTVRFSYRGRTYERRIFR